MTDCYRDFQVEGVNIKITETCSSGKFESKKYTPKINGISPDSVYDMCMMEMGGLLITGEQLAMVSVSPHAQWWDHTSLAGPGHTSSVEPQSRGLDQKQLGWKKPHYCN